MSNGVNFRQIAVELREQLTASEKLSAELLEALEQCLALAESYWKSGDYSGSEDIKDWPEITNARAAIAKAKGEQQ